MLDIIIQIFLFKFWSMSQKINMSHFEFKFYLQKTEFLPNEDSFKFEVSNILKLKTGIKLISAQTLVIVAKSVFSHL